MKEFFPIIRSSQLFSGVSEEELTAMLSCLETRRESFPKDALLLRIGDTADAIGLVLSGSILIIQEDIWGNRNIISKAGVGQTFAAAYACAPGSVLNVSVVAETAVTVLYLNIKRVLHVRCVISLRRKRAPKARKSLTPSSYSRPTLSRTYASSLTRCRKTTSSR